MEKNKQNTTQQMRMIKDDILKCFSCGAHYNCKTPIVGYGIHKTPILIVGDYPVDGDMANCIPFANDKRYDTILSPLDRDKVYTTFAIRCLKMDRIKTKEFDKCKDFLSRQIKAINPLVIFTIGDVATKLTTSLVAPDLYISSTIDHGKLFSVNTDQYCTNIVPSLDFRSDNDYNLIACAEDFKSALHYIDIIREYNCPVC